ncbi:MAG TPA: SRPBCC family protein [Chloroflexota bacterium]|nr:SRPBCC family protein [Chloroflexota bacterium]
MGRLHREIVINAPPEAVFAFLAQPERLPEWTPGVISVRRTSDGPTGVNTTTETVVEAFGVRQTLLGRCLVFEPPRRLAVHNVTASGISIGGVSIGQVSTTSASELLPEGTGTRLRAALDYTLSAGILTSLAERVAGPQMQADFDRSLQNLKRLLESPPAGG